MFEVIVLFMVLILLAACTFSPLGGGVSFFSKPLQLLKNGTKAAPKSQIKTSEETQVKLHFLTYLQSQIEAELFPRPTDSVLQRHYDALVEMELKNRLAIMAE